MATTNTITKYLDEHCITPEIVKAYDLTFPFAQTSIRIPVYDKDRKFLFNKYRMFGMADKYRYDKGSSMALYNAHRITNKTRLIYIVEGEFDCMVLQNYFDTIHPFDMYVAVTSTGGAGSWNEQWNELVRGYTVTVLLDNDDAGIKGSVKLWKSVGTVTRFLQIWKIKYHKDICEVFKNMKGKNFFKEMYPAIDIYCSYYEIETGKNWREKSKVFKNIFERLDEMELCMTNEPQMEYVNALRLYVSKLYEEMKPTPRNKKIFIEDGDITLDRLRTVPITNFVKFNREGTAKCVFHSDNDPSMHYNPPNSKFPNTVKCYSCGKFAGVVDVVMAINNCGFVEAVDILKKHL